MRDYDDFDYGEWEDGLGFGLPALLSLLESEMPGFEFYPLYEDNHASVAEISLHGDDVEYVQECSEVFAWLKGLA